MQKQKDALLSTFVIVEQALHSSFLTWKALNLIIWINVRLSDCKFLAGLFELFGKLNLVSEMLFEENKT